MNRGTKIAGAVVLGAGLAVLPLTGATGHANGLKVTASCNTATGQYDFVATQEITNTNLDGNTIWRIGTGTFEGTPNSAAGMTLGPVSSHGSETITLGTWSMPGTTTGLGPWVYSYTTWTDGYQRGADGQLLQPLDGKCSIPIETVVIAPSIDHLDPCGPDNLILNVPEDIEGVTYTVTKEDTYTRVVADAQAGYQLTFEGEHFFYTTEWQFEDSNEPCPVTPTPEPSNPPELPYTGVNDNVWTYLISGGALIGLGFIVWLIARDERMRF